MIVFAYLNIEYSIGLQLSKPINSLCDALNLIMSSNQIGGQAVAMRTRRSFLGYQQSKSESIIVLQHSQGHNQHKCIVIEDSELSQSAPQPQQREELIEMHSSNSQQQAEASPNQSRQRKGRFSPAEQKIITDSVGEFLAQREISYQDFLILLNKKNVINTFLKKEKLFHILASRLPGRTPFCCYRFVKRQFNKDNRKGKWSAQEEKRLVKLVEKYGHNWTEIAQQLGRTSDNVYDKFKAMGSENSHKRSKNRWELKEFVHLLMQVNSRVKTKFLIEEIEKELQSERYYNALESLSQRQSKYNTINSAKPLIELALRYVNEDIKRIDVQGISWSCIAVKLKRRSPIDCKNKFMQLFEYVLKKLKFENMLIVEFVEKQGVEEEAQIDWLKWQHPRACYQQAKNRYNLLKKSIKNKQPKKFADIVREMRLKLSRRNAFD